MVHFIKWVLKLGVSEIKKISKKNNLSQKVAKHQIAQMDPEAVFFSEIKKISKKNQKVAKHWKVAKFARARLDSARFWRSDHNQQYVRPYLSSYSVLSW